MEGALLVSTGNVTGSSLEAWQRLMKSHCVVVRTLDTDMQHQHGITLSDYDVLVQLRDADGHHLRMSDLSRRTTLTRSGMTRLVHGLQRDGLVERRSCAEDARVSYAALTPRGLEVVTAARESHHAGIRRVFADHFSDAEAAQLAELLGRIPGVDDVGGCCPG